MKTCVCLDCGEVRSIRCRGRCSRCYDKWIYRNSPSLREKKLARMKNYSLRSAKPEEWRQSEGGKEHRREARRQWWANHPEASCWPVGSKVFYVFVAGFPPIVGEILSKTKSVALVQFATFQKRIPFAQLMKEADAGVSEVA